VLLAPIGGAPGLILSGAAIAVDGVDGERLMREAVAHVLAFAKALGLRHASRSPNKLT